MKLTKKQFWTWILLAAASPLVLSFKLADLMEWLIHRKKPSSITPLKLLWLKPLSLVLALSVVSLSIWVFIDITTTYPQGMIRIPMSVITVILSFCALSWYAGICCVDD